MQRTAKVIDSGKFLPLIYFSFLLISIAFLLIFIHFRFYISTFCFYISNFCFYIFTFLNIFPLSVYIFSLSLLYSLFFIYFHFLFYIHFSLFISHLALTGFRSNAMNEVDSSIFSVLMKLLGITNISPSFTRKYFGVTVILSVIFFVCTGAAVAEWLSSWLAEQEDRGSIPGLATWIFSDWLSPASKSRYGWKIAKSTLILKTTNQPIFVCTYTWDGFVHGEFLNV